MRQSWQNPGGEYTVSYSYLAANGLLGEMGIYLPGNLYSATSTSNTPDVKLSYTYDALNRLSRRTTVVNGTEQFYSGAWYAETAGGDGNQRTNQVKHYNYRVSATSDLIAGYQYAYDARGNISTETTTASGSVLSYTYDGQNQLTTVKNGSGTTLYSYSYDTMGNIRSKTDGSVTHLYTYGNSQWADLLTAYDGHTITYDGSGNPLSYYNGADYTFTWEQGRQLASVTKGNKTASYTYDMSGVRSGKVVNGVSYEYTTLSGKITRMTWSGNAVDIVYDDAGRPYILRYTPSGGATQTYYYVLNLQGDVVGLMNTSMQMVVRYSYDPWGKLTGTTATSAYVALAQANPLRYRSYCYDIETGFYYLQTRYYDPTIARFINADSYLSTGATGLLSYNMFAYCENNPVMYSDIGGSVRNYCVMEADNGTPGVVEAVAREAKGKGITGFGVSAVAGWVYVANASVFYVKDAYGDEALLVVAGAGGGLNISRSMEIGGPSLSGLYISFPDADRISDLEGSGATVGATIGIFSGDMSIATSGKQENSYDYGGWFSPGLEFHAVITYCWVIPLN